jgi:spermidine synthase
MLFALGFLSIGTQLYLVRECMMVFNDNELIVGLVLAMWMLITGIGSSLGRFSKVMLKRNGLLISSIMIAGLLPSLMVTSTDVLKVAMVPYGCMAGLWQVLVACILVQLPFCLLNGFLFSFLSIASPDNSPAGAYSWESLGSMASGVLINFLFLWILGPFQSLLILTGVYLLLVVNFTRITAGNKKSGAVLCVSVVCLVVLGITNTRALTESMLYQEQRVISDAETPYGQVVVTKNQNQFNFFENGILLFSSGNEISNEESVHYAMLQHPDPENILLISGGFSGTLAEIIKYDPVRVDYVELNPSLVGIASRFTRQLDHPSVRTYGTDARRFVRTSANSYDVVLVNLPPPSTLQLNRYYSLEFLKEVRHKMRPGAVIAFSLPASGEYVSGKAGLLNTVLWNTLKQCFSRVLILPAGRNYFLASDSALSLDIPGLVRARGISTAYVNEYYIDPVQLKERSEDITGFINTTPSGSPALSGLINRDFTPVAVWYQMSWWLSQFQINRSVILFVFIVVLLVLMITLNPLSAGLFAGGFTLASAEIILIFGMQIVCGYLFQAIGAIIMVFMLGLAVGSGIRYRPPWMCTLGFYRWLQLLLAFLAFMTPFVILWLGRSGTGDWLVNLVFALLSFSLAFIVGLEYRMAALLSDRTAQKTVAGNYSAEMFGSAAGAFAVTLFLIPAIGMTNTGIFLAAMNLTTAGSLFLLRRKS